MLGADRWVSRSVVQRSNAIVVFGLSKWLMKSSADRFTTPYANTPLTPAQAGEDGPKELLLSIRLSPIAYRLSPIAYRLKPKA